MTRSVFALALAVAAQAATVEIGPRDTLTLGTGESVLVEFRQLQPDRWTDLDFVRFTAHTPTTTDYAATALAVQFESPDGGYVVDTGTHQLAEHHYYAQSFGTVIYDFYAGRLVAQVLQQGSVYPLMDAEKRLRVRMVNHGIPVTFDHGVGDTPPFGMTGRTGVFGFSQGAGLPVHVWHITPEAQGDAVVPMPEPSTWALCGVGLLLLCKRSARVRIAQSVRRHSA